MYHDAYAAITQDRGSEARLNEHRAFEMAIALLEKAEAAGPGSPQSLEALIFSHRLWTTLLEDLGHAENALPKELKASLISIGIWALRRCEDLRQGRVASHRALIDVSQSILQGLEHR